MIIVTNPLIIHSLLISKQQEIFNKFVDQRLEKITNLDKKVTLDDLIYRYKGFTADATFNEFDNAFSYLDKKRDGKMSLADAKNAEFKSNLSQIKKKTKNIDQWNKKIHFIILKFFTKQGTYYWFFWWLFFNGIWSRT